MGSKVTIRFLVIKSFMNFVYLDICSISFIRGILTKSSFNTTINFDTFLYLVSSLISKEKLGGWGIVFNIGWTSYLFSLSSPTLLLTPISFLWWLTTSRQCFSSCFGCIININNIILNIINYGHRRINGRLTTSSNDGQTVTIIFWILYSITQKSAWLMLIQGL